MPPTDQKAAMKTQHSPTPWNYREKMSGITIFSNKKSICQINKNYKNINANAAFIIRAVNCHEAYEYLAEVAGRVRSVLNGENKELLTKSQMENLLFEALEDIAKAETL